MRDLNRKGAEKEGGTDMDAFTEPSPEETLPLMPSSLSPSSQPLAPATPNKVTDNQIVKVSARTWIYLAQLLNVDYQMQQIYGHYTIQTYTVKYTYGPQSQLTTSLFFRSSLHVSAPTGHPQVKTYQHVVRI
jgi:hypothetical protein